MTTFQDQDNTLKILLATDIHLGYNETHPTRADDSFITFEEILRIGKKHKVDFVLLGGDLFHDGRPSVSCLSKCMDLLNRYCMGDGEVKINVLSDPAEIFSFSANPMVNYMNPNLNVALPVFSIHGNHDDPLGYNAKCSLDMLSAAGLINYFGKYTNLQEDISLVPLLISKGTSKVAIYGLGALKDKMAHRLFRTAKVNLMQPDDHEDWFNIMVVHQNRSNHTAEECLQESFLPDSMDLIFWGHEHECRIKPEWNPTKNFYVTQPGSSVATSLSESESVPKHVGILHVNGSKFQIQPIPLKTVRPFVFENVDLAIYRDRPDVNLKHQGVQAFLESKVEEMLVEAEKQLTGNSKQPTLPLIRLRVEFFSQDDLFNIVRFGLQYEDKVANPTDMIMIKRPQGTRIPKTGLDSEAFVSAETDVVLHNVEELIEKYFKDCDVSKRMQVLPVAAMNEALAQQMKGDNVAFDIVIRKIKEKTVKSMLEKNLFEEDDIKEEFEVIRDQENQVDAEQVIREVQTMLEQPRVASEENGNYDDATIISDDDETEEQPVPTRGRGRGARGGRARGRGRQTTIMSHFADESIPDSGSPAPKPARGRGSRGGRGSRSRAAKATQPVRVESPPALNITRTKRATAGNRMAFMDDSD